MKSVFHIVGTYQLSETETATWEADIVGTWANITDKARAAFNKAIPFNRHLLTVFTIKG